LAAGRQALQVEATNKIKTRRKTERHAIACNTKNLKQKPGISYLKI
jgi:hypothetical protein